MGKLAGEITQEETNCQLKFELLITEIEGIKGLIVYEPLLEFSHLTAILGFPIRVPVLAYFFSDIGIGMEVANPTFRPLPDLKIR